MKIGRTNFWVSAIRILVAVLGLVFTACSDGGGGIGGPAGASDPGGPSGSTPIASAEITITAPVKGASPSTTAKGTGNFTIGQVSWTPTANSFLGGTVYTATTKLTADSGYTFAGLNYAKINGQNVEVSGNTGTAITLSHTFSATLDKIVTGIAVKTQPSNLTYMHNETLDLTGLVVTLTYDDATTEDVEHSNFAEKNITAVPSHGHSLVHSEHHDQPIQISYGGLTHHTSHLAVHQIPIANAEITVTAPVKGQAPDTGATGAGNFSIGTVSWSPDHGTFLGGTVYTASLTLTAESGYTFNGETAASIGGKSASVSHDTDGTITLSYTFSATDTRDATGMAVKTQPGKLTYTHGDQIDLTGLVITLTYDDTTAEDVAAANFTDKNITASPSHGNHLVRSTHNGQPVTITYGSFTQHTSNLTVNKAAGTFSPHAAINTTYAPGLTLNDLGSQLQSSYAWAAPSTSLNAGNGQSFTATYTDPSGNFNPVDGTITVNVAKAAGAAVNAPTLNTTTGNSITINAVTMPANGQTVEYGISTTNNSDAATWQPGLSFTGLSAGTTYYIFARSAENDNYNAGTASASLQVPAYTITFDLNGGNWGGSTNNRSEMVRQGSLVTQPADPTRRFYLFDGWYTDVDGTGTAWSFASNTVSGNIILYAKWTFMLTSTTEVNDYLNVTTGGTDTDSPIYLPVQIDLGDMGTGSNWATLLTVLNTRAKYVSLDLSTCTITDTEFNPSVSLSSGKNRIVNITLPDAVLSIPSGTYSSITFSSFTMLKSVTGTNVTTIGNYIFGTNRGPSYSLSTLATFSFPRLTAIGEYTFNNCTGLAMTSLPESLTSIGPLAFNYCSSLALTSLPEGLTSIGGSAFARCTSLALTSLPSGITTISEGVFYGCTSLALTSLPSGVTSIGNSAFYDCRNLALTSLPSGVTSIGSEAFSGCISLTNITIPASVTSIGVAAFYNCSSLTNITFPADVILPTDTVSGRYTYGNNVFAGCRNLTFTLTGTGILSVIENGRALVRNTNELIAYPSARGNYTVHNSITSIGSGAFSRCTNLTNITIPVGVTSIGSGAFSYCSSLTNITIPTGVTSIDNIFYECRSLIDITLPESITSIGTPLIYIEGDGTFVVPSVTITIYATTPPAGVASSFGVRRNRATIWVPAASLEAYNAADTGGAYYGLYVAIP